MAVLPFARVDQAQQLNNKLEFKHAFDDTQANARCLGAFLKKQFQIYKHINHQSLYVVEAEVG